MPSNEEVVIKEARPNTGFVGLESAIPRLQREVRTLMYINSCMQDLAPRVRHSFSVQGHEYVALEYMPGTPLSEWIARENPLYSAAHRLPEQVEAYLDRASRILSKTWEKLNHLHDLGLAYGDLSVGNIIIDEDENPHFIDFESCTPLGDTTLGLRTPDFCLLHQSVDIAACERDIYAFHCIAVSLVLRVTTLAEISDQVFSDLSSDLSNIVGCLPDWWLRACDYLTEASRTGSSCKAHRFKPPTLGDYNSRVAARRLLADAIVESYDSSQSMLFPSSAAAREGAFLSYGCGASGILEALKKSSYRVDHQIANMYTRSVEAALDGDVLPINYDIGLVGVIRSCLELGEDRIADRILRTIKSRWTEVAEPGVASGLTGIALALSHYGEVALAEEVMNGAIEMARHHPWTRNGLLYGRAGVVAGACQIISVLSSDRISATAICELIQEELEQTVRHPVATSLSLRGEPGQGRLLPYLSDGTAGLLLALMLASRCSALKYFLEAETLTALAADLETPFMLEGSLMDGAAGLCVVLEIARSEFPDLKQNLPKPNWRRLEKYFLPLGSGVGVLHPKTLKFDLSHSQGSAGIIEALLWVDGEADLNICGLQLAAINPIG